MMHAAIAMALWTTSLLCAAWMGRSGRIDRRDFYALLVVAGLAGSTAALLAVLALSAGDTTA